MNFTKLQDRVFADLDFRNRLVTYPQTAVSEVVDEMWAEEYKDGHPDLTDLWITLTIPLNNFGPRWKQIPITCSHAAKCIAIP